MKHLERYSDYLICNAAGYATATGLSAMIEGNVSHDQITRFLSGEKQGSKELWLKVKSVVRQIEVLFVRRIFKNKEGSTGRLDLVCSDLTCDGEQVATTYEKRCKVEEYHQSLKSNLGLTKSPTRTMTTQNNHVFMSIYGFFKLECLKIKHQLNHFSLRAKLLIHATQMAYAELAKLQAA